MSSKKVIRIGTRGSKLALAQASQIKSRLEKLHPRLQFSLEIIKTTGDEFQTVELFKKNNIGVFTKKIEEQLLKNKIDIALHSLKDLPTSLPKGLTLATFPKRLDASDVLITKGRYDLKSLPKGARVGTASLRRKRQLLLARPDLKIMDMRGNLDTRVSKVLDKKKYDAIVVAKAGLLRLGRYLKNARSISPQILLPAVGQAALAVETRSADKALNKLLKKINDPSTELCVKAERLFLKELQGGCRVPAGIFSKLTKGNLYMKAAVFSVSDESSVLAYVEGPAKKYESLAKRLAAILLANGARGFLKEARNEAN